MSWKIKDYKAIDSGALKGSFTLDIGQMEIRGWKHFQKDGKSWVTPPQCEYEEDGETRYCNFCYFPDRDVYRRFQT
jgi:hypothetical protein